MNADDIDRELGGPMVVREQGQIHTLLAATSLSWRVVSAAILDPQYFAAFVWPQGAPLASWKVGVAQDAWCRHNRLPGPDDTRQLIHYVERYYEALEYDLRGHLQVSLGDLWRERRWRELIGYIQNLPGNTKLNAALSSDEEYLEVVLRRSGDSRTKSGPSMSEWDLHADLLANLVDAVRTNNEIARASAGGKPSQVKPYPRPATAADEIRERITRERHQEMASILLRDRPKRAGMMQGSTPPPAE